MEEYFDNYEYDKKKLEIKDKKRKLNEINFKSSNERKSIKDNLNKEYRSVKRAEKSKIKKDIKNIIDNLE